MSYNAQDTHPPTVQETSPVENVSSAKVKKSYPRAIVVEMDRRQCEKHLIQRSVSLIFFIMLKYLTVLDM